MSNYTRGRALEYAVRDHLGRLGYRVIRAASSKGAADLIAARDGLVLVVQCKLDGKIPPAEREALLDWAGHFDGTALVAYRKRGVQFDVLSGTGVRDREQWRSV